MSVAFAAPPPPPAADPPSPALTREPEVEATQNPESRFRLVLELDGADEIEVGFFDKEDDAEAAARNLIGRIEGEQWPRIGQRFISPARIVSVAIRERARS